MISSDAIEQTITRLHQDTLVPAPSATQPITRLGLLLERAQIALVEQPQLTSAFVAQFLQSYGVKTVNQTENEPNTPIDLAGYCYAAADLTFLFVRSDDPVTRRRFTIAHELGHYYLHFQPTLARWHDEVEQHVQQGTPLPTPHTDGFPGEDAPAPKWQRGEAQSSENEEEALPSLPNTENAEAKKTTPAQPEFEQEAEANLFAAALLMPASVIRACWKQAQTRGITRPVLRLDWMAQQMLVSRAAVKLRAASLGLTAQGGG